MISVLLLLGWMAAGIIAVVLTEQRETGRRQSFPLAVVLGPLWVPVAQDRQVVAPLTGDDLGR